MNNNELKIGDLVRISSFQYNPLGLGLGILIKKRHDSQWFNIDVLFGDKKIHSYGEHHLKKISE